MPAGARYCGRPSMFGNPFKIGTRDGLVREPAADMVTPWEYEGRVSSDGADHPLVWPSGQITDHTVRYMTVAESVATFRRALIAPTEALHLSHRPGRAPATRVTINLVRFHLAGLDLACWCAPGQPCHADVLLWVANAPHAEVKEAAQDEYAVIREMAERVIQLHPEVLCVSR